MRYKLVIPSYGRWELAAKHPLLEAAYLVVPASQEQEYQRTCGDKCLGIITHPDLKGLPRTRNFIIQEVYDPATEEFIFQADDDIDYVRYLMTRRVVNLTRPRDILPVIEHTARLALDTGTNLFGYAHTPRPNERTAETPFRWRTYISSVAMGIIGQGQLFDENLVVKSDVDFSLQTLERYRVACMDRRYSWAAGRWTRGGLADQRTTASTEAAVEYLAMKWGKGIVRLNKKKRSTGEALQLNVGRGRKAERLS